MYRTLFELAGPAIVAWLLLVFLPGWRVTRRIADTAIFPAYLAVLYVVGLVAVLRASGPGFMADFGSADGVVQLLAFEPIALVAWIHILAFDQVVGLLIYRDNMKHRFVPLPVQSVILAATLLLGPVGFLAYWAVRMSRARSGRVAWGEREPEPARTPLPAMAPVRFAEVAPKPSLVAFVAAAWRREPALLGLGALGLVLAGACAVVAAVNGGWLLAPEGRLLEAAKFDVAIAIFFLTLAVMLPLAPFSARGRRRWVAWTVGLGLFAYGMENVQAWRGLDPRFSSVAGPVDQALGGVFFLSALGLMVVYLVLAASFFRRDALPDHPALRNAIRYATVASMSGFGVGIVMSVAGGRFVAGDGNLMPIHAAGFHGLQAVPVVALLLGWSVLGMEAARRWTHLGGAGWLALCAGLTLQAFSGRPPEQLSPALALALAGFLAWAAVAGYALRARAAGGVRPAGASPAGGLP